MEDFLKRLYQETQEPIIVSLQVDSIGCHFESCISRKRWREINNESEEVEESIEITKENERPLVVKKQKLEYFG